MKTEIDKQFCDNLGKLLYAIALCDKSIDKIEYDTIREVTGSLKEVLLNVGIQENIDIDYHVSSAFNTLYLDSYDVQTSFEDFLNYKRQNEDLFSESLSKIILEIANKVASSFSGRNKSELIMLAQLSIELKK